MARKSKFTPPESELDLKPFMNLVMMLIPFLLLSSEFITFGIVNVSLPSTAAGGGGAAADNLPQKEPLNLTVTITARGHYVAAAAGVLAGAEPAQPGQDAPPTVPKLGDNYDYKRLTQILVDVKKKRPEETKIIVVADEGIIYRHVVDTLDATRETPDREIILFPDVAFSVGF